MDSKAPMLDEVLILEPDALQRDLLAMALRRIGYEPVLCQRGAEVSRILLKRKPVLLILDIYQDDKNGLDLLDELRQAGLLVLTRVILISSMAFPEIIKRATRLGVADFLVKPLNTDLLVEHISRVMESRKSERG